MTQPEPITMVLARDFQHSAFPFTDVMQESLERSRLIRIPTLPLALNGSILGSLRHAAQ